MTETIDKTINEPIEDVRIRERRRKRLRGVLRRLSAADQYDALRWVLEEVPGLVEEMEDACVDFRAMCEREQEPPRWLTVAASDRTPITEDGRK